MRRPNKNYRLLLQILIAVSYFVAGSSTGMLFYQYSKGNTSMMVVDAFCSVCMLVCGVFDQYMYRKEMERK